MGRVSSGVIVVLIIGGVTLIGGVRRVLIEFVD